MAKTFTKEELQEMVSSLESEFLSLMKSAQEEVEATKPLAESKESEEEKEAPKEEKEAKTDSEEKKDEEDEQKDEDSHDYDEEDLEEIHKMYSAMTMSERKCHMDALKKCGTMKQMSKSEKSSTSQLSEDKANSDEVPLLKTEIENIRKENEELKKNLNDLITSMNLFLSKKTAPPRKAITEIEFIKKSEDASEEKKLTKSEIDKILSKKVVDPSLTKADREAINAFYLNNAGVESIKHLLKQ